MRGSWAPTRTRVNTFGQLRPIASNHLGPVRRMICSGVSQMTEFSGTAVVVGVDGSAAALAAVRLAAEEAALRAGRLRIVHGFLWPTYQVPNYAALRRDAERLVDEAVAVAASIAPGTPVSGHIVDGEPGAVLRMECRTAALVVLGPSDPAHHRAAVDSVVEYVAARTRCPVMVAHQTRLTGGPVLVGVDGSADSAAAVRFAAVEAAARETDLVAVHVERGDGDADGPLADALAAIRRAAPQVKVQKRWIRGDPREALVSESAAAALVVVGARGHVRTLLGAVSYALLRNAHCPVAVVRR
jgi:nucleotide-binding universal stress UspA family protein